MKLTLQSRTEGDVVVVRCKGHIISGEEVRHLQVELENLTYARKKVVLHLAEVGNIDSGGLGCLVRHFGILRNRGGDLKLCELSPFAVQVLKVTNLLSLFPPYASEEEAMGAFSERSRSPEATFLPGKTTVVCVDTSLDLVAYLSALLKRSGYEVFTTAHASHALTLVHAIKPDVVIYGPGMPKDEEVIERFRKNAQVVFLPADFPTSEAGQAGIEIW